MWCEQEFSRLSVDYAMNRFGNKGTMCPLFCCFFLGRCCGIETDEDDLRRPILKGKHFRNNKTIYYKRTKPRDINKQRRSRLDPDHISPSPVIHSGLKRLPFNGTLSDLTERSEDESCATASTAIDDQPDPSFQFDEPSLMISMEENVKSTNKNKK